MEYTPLPAGGGEGRAQMSDLIDHLLEITVTQGRYETDTEYGKTIACKCDIRDVEDGEVYPDTAIFQVAMVSALGSLPLGSTVLAWLRVGIAKPGKSAPYILIDASGDPEAVARAQQGRQQPVAAPTSTDDAISNLKDLLA